MTQKTQLMRPPVKEPSGGERRKNKSIWDYAITYLPRCVGILIARATPFAGLAPFGAAFLAMERRFSIDSLVSMAMVSIGYLTLGNPAASVRYIAACLAYLGFLFVLDRKRELSITAAMTASGAVVALGDMGAMIWAGFSGEGALLMLCDILMAEMGILAFDRGRKLMNGRNILHRLPNEEERLSLGVVTAVVLLSFQNLRIGEGFGIGAVLGLLLLGIVAVSGGPLLASAAGIMIGVIVGLGGDLAASVAIFGVCGVVCGFASRWGKFGSAGAMIVSGVLMTAYVIETGAYDMSYFQAPVAAILLMLMPEPVFAAAKRLLQFDLGTSEEARRYKGYVQERLHAAAGSFRNLAGTFLDLSDKENQVDMNDIAQMFDTAADRVCRPCSRVSECWNRNFNATYKTMFKALEIMERKGELTEEDMDGYFASRCIRLRSLVREMNRLFEVYKLNQVWKSKLCENREMVGEQLAGVARIMDNIAGELDQFVTADGLAAREIQCRLEARGVAAGELQVTQDREGRFAVLVSLESKPEPEVCVNVIEPVLKGVLGVPLKAPRTAGCEEGRCTLRFCQQEGLAVKAGFACGAKNGESGDNHGLHHISCGKYMAALSDGMGTGHRASRESGAIVNLLSDFLDAGFEKEVAVKLINSIMVMKSVDEAFATVDMCVIDLYTGEVEFIKNGAEPSYIRGKKGTETVRAASLPVGIMSGVEVQSFAHRVEPGDTIVMVSDGVEVREGHEGWIRRMVDMCQRNMPPQELAERIMEKSMALKGGEADDDMTVIVLQMEEGER